MSLRFVALATDYDETLADHGRVRPEAVRALARVKASGRRIILVTGRELADVRRVFPQANLFDAIVAENGGVLHVAETREERVLGDPVSEALLGRLAARGVEPLSAGRVIIATREPNQIPILEEIQHLGLELQVIFNKGAVMVLPPGVHKGSGLRAALGALRLSPRNTVAVGDAENDHALISDAECGVAVANALPALKQHADWVLAGRAGAGVVELADQLCADDLASLPLTRRRIVLGQTASGDPVSLAPAGARLLVAGSPGSGKSTAAKGVIERIVAAGYQCLIVDPEGDFEDFPDALVLGDGERPPTADEVASALGAPDRSVVANLVGLPPADRPALFAELVPRVVKLRAATGRPHWLILDEAHHVAPAASQGRPSLTGDLGALMLITVVPHEVAPALLEPVDTAMVVGKRPLATLADFARAARRQPPAAGAGAGIGEELGGGEAVLWSGGGLVRFTVAATRSRHQRHLRKYAQGELPRERSFYFRGPRGRLNLRAQNLAVFCQLAEGVDDATWRHHLRAGDVARWFREVIKDATIAAIADAAARDRSLPSAETRRRVVAAILERYTLPAGTLPPVEAS